MPIGAIIGGVASIGGSILSSRSQRRSARRAEAVATQNNQANNALARDMYNTSAGILSPFQQRGNQAGDAINALLGLGGQTTGYNPEEAFSGFRNSTGYNFRMGEGIRAIDAGAPVRNSGATLKARQQFGQNLASGEFGNYLGYLSNQQGVGLSGASAQAGVGQNYVNSVTANNNQGADARMNALLARGQANANMWGGIASGAGQIFGSSFGR
jgi:hypothetical protein